MNNPLNGNEKVFVWDTSSFIGLHRHYPPEVFPTIWKHTERLILNGKVISSNKVLLEIEYKNDDVTSFVKNHPGMFLDVTTAESAFIRELSLNKKVKLSKSRHAKKDAVSADTAVIALAYVTNGYVVTEEVPQKNPEKLKKIPNICDEYGIPWIHFVDLMKIEEWRF